MYMHLLSVCVVCVLIWCEVGVVVCGCLVSRVRSDYLLVCIHLILLIGGSLYLFIAVFAIAVHV